MRGGELSDDAQSQQVAEVTVPGTRGAILDRNGNELAVSEDAATIIATPYQVEDPAGTAAKLASILDVSEKDLLEKLSDRLPGANLRDRRSGEQVGQTPTIGTHQIVGGEQSELVEPGREGGADPGQVENGYSHVNPQAESATRGLYGQRGPRATGQSASTTCISMGK